MKKTLACWLIVIGCSMSGVKADTPKARQVVDAAIEAMGGKAYLDIQNSHSTGENFIFDRDGNKGFARYEDWTVYQPVKWRFQTGKGKNADVDIYNLELNKGWSKEGKYVEEIKPEKIEDFRKNASRDMDLILRHRLGEEGLKLFYYGPDDVAGEGNYEAVEFLDSTNQSVIMFFDLKTHLPVKLETQTSDKMGLRHKEETEFLNWHTIQNVNTPLRLDVRVDGEMSQQRFVETIEYNLALSDDLFLEPKVESKK